MISKGFTYKHLIVASTIILLGITDIFAQNVVARLDLGRRDPKPSFYEYSPADQGVVTLGPTRLSSSRYVGLVKYDANLKQQWKKDVLEQNGNKNIDFVSVIGEYIFVFVSEFFPKEKVIKTYYYSYDLAGNEIADESILSVYPNQKEQKVELQYILSPNKRRLLAYKNLKNRRDSETILYYIFDDEGDYVQNGEIELKYPDDRFRVRSLRISNIGNIYVLGKYYRVRNVRDSDDFKYLINRHDISTQIEVLTRLPVRSCKKSRVMAICLSIPIRHSTEIFYEIICLVVRSIEVESCAIFISILKMESYSGPMGACF